MASRPCRKCGEAFEPRPHQIRKSDYICGECRKAECAQSRARRKADGKSISGSNMPHAYKQAWQRAYRQRPGVLDLLAARQKQYRETPALRARHAARWAVTHAIASGRLIRQPCEVCAAADADAHHDDYGRPLDVRWLCPTHHTAHHVQARKESNNDH